MAGPGFSAGSSITSGSSPGPSSVAGRPCCRRGMKPRLGTCPMKRAHAAPGLTSRIGAPPNPCPILPDPLFLTSPRHGVRWGPAGDCQVGVPSGLVPHVSPRLGECVLPHTLDRVPPGPSERHHSVPFLVGHHRAAALEPLEETGKVRRRMLADEKMNVVLYDACFEDQRPFLPSDVPEKAVQESGHP